MQTQQGEGQQSEATDHSTRVVLLRHTLTGAVQPRTRRAEAARWSMQQRHAIQVVKTDPWSEQCRSLHGMHAGLQNPASLCPVPLKRIEKRNLVLLQPLINLEQLRIQGRSQTMNSGDLQREVSYH